MSFNTKSGYGDRKEHSQIVGNQQRNMKSDKQGMMMNMDQNDHYISQENMNDYNSYGHQDSRAERDHAKKIIEEQIMGLAKQHYDEPYVQYERKRQEQNRKQQNTSNDNQSEEILTLMTNQINTSQQLQQEIESCKNLDRLIRDRYKKILMNTYEICRLFSQQRKCFPVKPNERLKNTVRDYHIQMMSLQKNVRLLETSYCCGGNRGKIKLEIEQNILKINEINYFWNQMKEMEARDGFQEILIPPTKFKNIEYQFKQEVALILEKTMPKTQVIVKKEPVQQKIVQTITEDILRRAHELLYGINRYQDVNGAIKIYQQEADKIDPTALNCLGQIYMEGKFVEQNIGKALKYYESSCKSENPEAWYRLGKLIHYHNVKGDTIQVLNKKIPHNQSVRQIIRVMECYEHAASSEHSDALNALGYIYYKGYSENREIQVEKNIQKAIEYFKRAARLNNSNALNSLGEIYLKYQLDEKFQDQNIKKAIEYFRRSVELLNSSAMMNLSTCYKKGLGVKKDIDQSKLWANRAAAIDPSNVHAQMVQVDNMLENAIISQQESDYLTIFNNLNVVIQKDPKNRDAYYFMGFLFETGLGVSRDHKLAFLNYKKAADLNLKEALNKVGDYFYSGQALEYPDINSAINYYSEASTLGSTNAMLNLGSIYEEGVDGQPNYQKAYQYYLKAAESDDSNGYLNIGLMHEQGRYFEQDSSKAIENFTKAAKLGNYQALQFLKLKGVNVSEIELSQIMLEQKNQKIGKPQINMDKSNFQKSKFNKQNELNYNDHFEQMVNQ